MPAADEGAGFSWEHQRACARRDLPLPRGRLAGCTGHLLFEIRPFPASGTFGANLCPKPSASPFPPPFPPANQHLPEEPPWGPAGVGSGWGPSLSQGAGP